MFNIPRNKCLLLNFTVVMYTYERVCMMRWRWASAEARVVWICDAMSYLSEPASPTITA